MIIYFITVKITNTNTKRNAQKYNVVTKKGKLKLTVYMNVLKW